MLKIFAKYGTDEKTLVLDSRERVKDIKLQLNKKYGGEWLLVDYLEIGEILKFNDSLTYLGFHGNDERYCKGIDTLT